MSAAHIDSERMADRAAGTASWSDEEAAHLAGCAECRLELEIVEMARRLGTAQLTGLDPLRIAAGVRHRLATERVAEQSRIPRHPGRWLAGLAAAAVLVFAVRTAIPKGSGDRGPDGQPAPVVVSVLHELDGLTVSQLEDVLQSMPPASDALDHVEMAPLTDLSASDLERMLRSMED